MKPSFYFAVLLLAGGLMLLGMGHAGAVHSEAPVAAEVQDDNGTLMDLFLGMEYGDDGYTGTAPQLECLPGVTKMERQAKWYVNDADYSFKFRCSLGMYIDEEYPSEAVFRRVEEAIDSTVAIGLSCYDGIDTKAAFRLRELNKPGNAQQMLEYGRQVFDLYTRQMKASKPESAYEKGIDARVCVVGHKVYDKGNQATYLIEMSYDINGSCGCPSSAHFFTYEKTTGRILEPDDVIGNYGAENLKGQLWRAYKKAREERGYTDEDGLEVSRDELLTEVDGCALINEGLLFYYLPYHIGCGAEGEYFLVIGL